MHNLPSRVVCVFVRAFLQRKHTVRSVYIIFRVFAVRQERRRVRRPLRTHNLPMLVSGQVGEGPRQAGTHAIRERREAQVALTYSIVLAVLAH